MGLSYVCIAWNRFSPKLVLFPSVIVLWKVNKCITIPVLFYWSRCDIMWSLHSRVYINFYGLFLTLPTAKTTVDIPFVYIKNKIRSIFSDVVQAIFSNIFHAHGVSIINDILSFLHPFCIRYTCKKKISHEYFIIFLISS